MVTRGVLSSLDPNSTHWLAVAVAMATIAYVVVRPMFKKRDPLTKSSGTSSLAQQRSVEREMSNLLVELSEMTRQLSAQLDTRSAKLEELLRQADAKIAELRAAGLLTPGSHALLSATPALPAPLGDGDSAGAAGHPLSGLGLIPADNAGVPARLPALARAGDMGSRSEIDPGHAAIYAFVDQGLSLQEIAQRLGRPAGEVQLIVNLRSRS